MQLSEVIFIAAFGVFRLLGTMIGLYLALYSCVCPETQLGGAVA